MLDDSAMGWRRWLVTACVGLAACDGPPDRTPTLGDADVPRGRQLVVEKGCVACHTFPDVPWPRGGLGPALDGFGHQGLQPCAELAHQQGGGLGEGEVAGGDLVGVDAEVGPVVGELQGVGVGRAPQLGGGPLEVLLGAPDVAGDISIDADVRVGDRSAPGARKNQLPDVDGRLTAKNIRVDKFSFAHEVESRFTVRDDVITSPETTVTIAGSIGTHTAVKSATCPRSRTLSATTSVPVWSSTLIGSRSIQPSTRRSVLSTSSVMKTLVLRNVILM